MEPTGNNLTEKELVFKFTKEESQIILNALLKEQCGTVLFVVNKLQAQAAEQLNINLPEPEKNDK